jgi:hypothetical protein
LLELRFVKSTLQTQLLPARLLNRLDGRPLRIAPYSRTVTAADIAATEADATILDTSPISEVDLYEN